MYSGLVTARAASKSLCTAGDIPGERKVLDGAFMIVSLKAPCSLVGVGESQTKMDRSSLLVEGAHVFWDFFFCWHFILESYPPILIGFILYFLSKGILMWFQKWDLHDKVYSEKRSPTSAASVLSPPAQPRSVGDLICQSLTSFLCLFLHRWAVYIYFLTLYFIHLLWIRGHSYISIVCYCVDKPQFMQQLS